MIASNAALDHVAHRLECLIQWKSEICVAHHFHSATRHVFPSDTSRRPGASHEHDETEHLGWLSLSLMLASHSTKSEPAR